MTRVKRAVSAQKKKKKVSKRVKGFGATRRSSYKKAKEAILKAEGYAYRDRKAKKRTMRSLWQTRISAAAKQYGLSYSKFMHLLKEKNILLDRKILAKLSNEFPIAFRSIVETVKSAGKK